ncbi:uncharacterized protein At4g00950 [Impatiens glandulifera]|uniref:uncharacterized protein At4g00950 n=1 Tax=Impatiens glandulifera TaxID=253017 RepID=UPI001FB08399|nr:uncharacterized protein At4g00950 [Impatiens glandulifera]
MEVMIPPSPSPVDFNFNFDSTSTTPFISAPSSPQPFGTNPLFYSAPASPTRISAFYRDFEHFYAGAGDDDGCDSPSSIPFKWEEKPGIRKTNDDFEFDFSGQLDITSVSAADELFDGGVIKPLKLPPRLHFNEVGTINSPKSPKPIIMVDPLTATATAPEKKETERGRGGERKSSSSSSSNVRRKGSRSLSPLRVFDIFSDHDQEDGPKEQQQNQQSSTSLISKWGWKSWKLKDLLLFRSASEGRATDKSPMMMMKKYEIMKKTGEEDVKNSSFRSNESSSGSVKGGGRRKGPPASAHEIHYTVNRAASEEMKRRTSLPYRHGLMGCLGFNPVVRDQISRRFESMTRGR